MATEAFELSPERIFDCLNQSPEQVFLDTAIIDHSNARASAQVVDLRGPRFDYLKGHIFGERVVIPGVTQVKMVADLLRLWAQTRDDQSVYVVSRVDGVRFKGVASNLDFMKVEISNVRIGEEGIEASGCVAREDNSKVFSQGKIRVLKYDPTVLPANPNRDLRPLGLAAEFFSSDQLDHLLPQKPPFRLVQSLSELEPGKKGVGELVDTADPKLDYLQYALEGKRFISPEFLIEAAAQVGTAVALSMVENQGRVPLFAAINDLDVRDLLLVGEQARLFVDVTKFRGPMGFGNARVVRADGREVLDGELVFATVDLSQI